MITPLARQASDKSQLREALKVVIDTALPLSPSQFAARMIQAKWGKDIDPMTAQLVTLDYNYRGLSTHNRVQEGRVASSQSLTHVLLANYQSVGDGRFGENAFALYTPPAIGPEVRIAEKGDELVGDDGGYYETYEGIYHRTAPQTYGPLTQIALRPADFKKWVWELEFKDQYSAYVQQSWPSDEVIVGPQACALRTSAKTAFVTTAYLQHQESSLSKKALTIALAAAGLDGEQTWDQLAVEQLQALGMSGSMVEAGRLAIYRYTSNDIWSFRHKNSEQIILYIPGNSSPLHDFANAQTMRQWVVEQGKNPDTKHALASHFAEADRHDGAFHAGVLTALDGMAIYPHLHPLPKGHGFFNDDGYWNPVDYIRLDVADEGTDTFAQLVLSMKQAANASIEAIRDDAQVNRDNLNAVLQPVVQWINTFGPLALFFPGGDGLLALAGIIDAGYGLDQAINGKESGDLSSGMTRTVFGLLNALPVLGSGAHALASAGAEGAEAVATDVAATAEHSDMTAAKPEAQEVPHFKGDLPSAVAPTPQVPAQSLTRVELLRGVGPSVASFSDEVLAQIGKVSVVDNDMLRLIKTGRAPTPLLADTISRFKIDQDLQRLSQPAGQGQRAELFQARYEALQHSDSEWIRLFQHQYPGLPKSAIAQTLERSGVDIHASPTLAEAKQMLKQLDGKATQYQQHVRLNRAYEGLYLHSMENPETDILVLHTLKVLPGWPKTVRIDVLDSSVDGRVLDHIGPSDAPVRRRLIKEGNRYQGYDAQGRLRQDTDDIYQAILGACSESERSALQLPLLDDIQDFKRKISQRALRRSELVAGLHRMDSGLSFDAQGLQGGGYPTTIQGEALSQHVMIFQVQEVYPDFTLGQAAKWLRELGDRAPAMLRRRKFEFEQLSLNLDGWVANVADDLDEMEISLLRGGDEGTEALDADQIEAENDERLGEAMSHERAVRAELAAKLKAFKQRRASEANGVYSGGKLVGYKLDLSAVDVHCLPVLDVKLSEVIELSMKNFEVTVRNGVNEFLECFPNLRTLNMEGFDLRLLNEQGVLECVLPPAITHMSSLISLNLKSTRLVMTETMTAQLSELVHLQALDLSDNLLSAPPVVLQMTHLKRLNLSNTGITTCPIGIPDQPRLASLDLSHNRISRIPPAVLAQAVARDRVQLWGNPVTDVDSLQRLITHREQTGLNLWLGAPVADFSQPAGWLLNVSKEREAFNRALWQRLEAKPGAKRLLRVLEGLSRTADFKVRYALVQERLWALLTAAGASEGMWEVLSRDVALSALDTDNPFVSFTRLENQVRVYREQMKDGVWPFLT